MLDSVQKEKFLVRLGYVRDGDPLKDWFKDKEIIELLEELGGRYLEDKKPHRLITERNFELSEFVPPTKVHTTK